jgi:hypothetical protein
MDIYLRRVPLAGENYRVVIKTDEIELEVRLRRCRDALPRMQSIDPGGTAPAPEGLRAGVIRNLRRSVLSRDGMCGVAS